MSREAGYYKIKDWTGEWVVGRWSNGQWYLGGLVKEVYDRHLQEINETRILMPDEKDDSDFVQKVNSLVQAFKQQELPDAETPFHFDAEGWSAMKSFLKFIESTAHENS